MCIYIGQVLVFVPNKLSFKPKPILWITLALENIVALTQHPTIWNLNKETNLLTAGTRAERIQES